MAQELDLADGEETSSAEISNDISIICREEKVPTYYASETSSADISIINREEKVPTLYASDSSGFCSDVDKRISGGYFGDVKIKNSKGITIGNQATLKGDVTINQYIYPDKVKEENPWTDCLPEPPNCVTLKNGKLDSKSDFRPKSNPILQITQQNSVSEKGFVREWWRWMSCAFAGAFLVMVILVFTIGLVNKQNSDEPKSPKQYPFIIPANLTEEIKVKLSYAVHVVQRDEWLAHSIDASVEDELLLPVPYIVIHQTNTEECYNINNCMRFIRSIQNNHISNGYGDISYNFLIGSDGYIYVGRSWEYIGACPFSRCSLSVAFIGRYENEQELSENQLKTLDIFLKVGVHLGKINKNYNIITANTLVDTKSPGYNVIKYIKCFPRYSSKKINNNDCLIRTDLNRTSTSENLNKINSSISSECEDRFKDYVQNITLAKSNITSINFY